MLFEGKIMVFIFISVQNCRSTLSNTRPHKDFVHQKILAGSAPGKIGACIQWRHFTPKLKPLSLCRKKDDGNGVTGKEEKRKTKEKIFRCCERRYGESESCCKGDGR